MGASKKLLQTLEHILVKIVLIRGDNLKLDHDMVELSGVVNKLRKEALSKNFKRFVVNFMFEISKIMKQNT